ncbi:MAG: hypothetical protein J5861_05015 [Desulfovibrio sp.]|nr:hypothetical protein [Desulfovibrio sp.]
MEKQPCRQTIRQDEDAPLSHPYAAHSFEAGFMIISAVTRSAQPLVLHKGQQPQRDPAGDPDAAFPVGNEVFGHVKAAVGMPTCILCLLALSRSLRVHFRVLDVKVATKQYGLIDVEIQLQWFG